MKVEFRFNGTNELYIIPENARDAKLLGLVFLSDSGPLGIKWDHVANSDTIRMTIAPQTVTPQQEQHDQCD